MALYMFNKDHYTTDVWKLYKNPYIIKCNIVELAHRFKKSTESKASISAFLGVHWEAQPITKL